jgi:NitT/TauT family transport system substrate-binding protein
MRGRLSAALPEGGRHGASRRSIRSGPHRFACVANRCTKEWENHCDDTVVTGVLVARKSFIEDNKEALEAFMEEYKASTTFANTNIDDTAALLEKYDIFKAAIAKKAIPYCNVTLITGEEMKTKAMSYLNVLFEENPTAVGGKLQEGMFYLED